jgi:hypothetical protein
MPSIAGAPSTHRRLAITSAGPAQAPPLNRVQSLDTSSIGADKYPWTSRGRCSLEASALAMLMLLGAGFPLGRKTPGSCAMYGIGCLA